jgi:predicted anti-sigma-YlaC factor YlaD
MKPCETLLNDLDAALAGTLPAELAEHLAGCPECQLAVERSRGLAEGGRAFRSLHAPAPLKQRIKAMPRLAPACEQAIELLGVALEGELSDDGRATLMGHIHDCAVCKAVWEAFATLREVGGSVRTPGRLRAAIAVPPTRRLETRRRIRFFDLRLATAAAYLIAALTVTLLSNPATLARASSERMDQAATYATAAVQNRFSSYSHRAMESLVATEGWVRDHAVKAWEVAKTFVGGKQENPRAGGSVSKDGGRP